MSNVKGKVLVVTGAGGGVGSVLTQRLLQEGAIVAAVDIRNEFLESLGQKVNSTRLSLHQCDITKREELTKLKEDVLTKHGKIDGVINNAGVGQPFIPFNDLEDEMIQRLMNINLNGPINLLKELYPEILKSSEGLIVNVSSAGGIVPVQNTSMYATAKAALSTFTDSLYSENLETNIQVMLVLPGAVKTDFVKNGGIETGKSADEIKATTPEKAVDLILKGIKKEKYRVRIGGDAKLVDRLSRLAPTYTIKFLVQMMKRMVG